MTNTRTKYAVAVVAAALVASLALVATVGLTRREADRGEPQGAPLSRPTAGIVITVDSISELPDACDGDSYWWAAAVCALAALLL